MDRTERLLLIGLRLNPGVYLRAEDLASDLEVSVRTIYRDMQALQQRGVDLEAVPGKGYRIDQGTDAIAIAFTQEEIEDLHTHSGGYVHGDAAALQSARQKLAAHLSDDAARSEPPVPRLFQDRTPDAIQDALQEALDSCRAVEMRIHGGTRTETMRVHPYGLLHQTETARLIGFDASREQVRAFPLDQVESAHLLEETFERPAGYGPPPRLRLPDRMINVRVAFDPEAAPLARRSAPEFVSSWKEGSQGIVAHGRVRHLGEVVPWVLGWGAHATVVEPAVLRRRLAEEARRLVDRYRDQRSLLDG